MKMAQHLPTAQEDLVPPPAPASLWPCVAGFSLVHPQSLKVLLPLSGMLSLCPLPLPTPVYL